MQNSADCYQKKFDSDWNIWYYKNYGSS